MIRAPPPLPLDPRLLQLLVVLVLILCNGFFAMSEMAVLTSRKSRLRQLAERSRRARKALQLAEHPEGFLSAVQLWITLLSLLIGYFGGESMGAKLAEPLADVPWLAPYAHQLGCVLGLRGRVRMRSGTSSPASPNRNSITTKRATKPMCPA